MTKLVLSFQLGLAVLIVALGAYVLEHFGKVEKDLASLREANAMRPAPGTPSAPAAPDPRLRKDVERLQAGVRRIEEKVQEVMTTFEWLLVDVDAIKRYAWDTLQALQSGDGAPEPEMPAEYKALFNPETRETLVRLAAEKGVKLLENRVEVPGVIIQNRATLEFVAVTVRGKVHESIVELTGNWDPESRKDPPVLAGTITSCILALGYEKGKPVRAERDGKIIPPQGEPIFVYVEWDDPESGERVRARAEDLVYNIEKQKSMERRKWVFVGSRFEKDWATGETVYLADLTGDVVATYSWPNTIIDNTTSEGSDDIYYTCFTPRIPKVGTKVVLVLSKVEMPAKEFPELPPEEGGETEDGGDGD